MKPYKTKLISPQVLSLKFDGVGQGWEAWGLLSSDRHHDSPYCDRKLELRHLEQAKERDAFVLDYGDWYDAMQGKYDPRRSLDGVREEDKGADYLDRLVAHSATFYAPYAKNIELIGMGNHEAAVLEHLGTNLIDRTIHELNKAGGNVAIGGLDGWVLFQFKMRKTVGMNLRLKYAHGTGGTNASVTRGVIQTNRQAVYQPDADIVCNGHNHENYYLAIKRERITQQGNVFWDLVHYLRTPGYKNEDIAPPNQIPYSKKKGMSPKARGCAWLRFYYEDGIVKVQPILDIT